MAHFNAHPASRSLKLLIFYLVGLAEEVLDTIVMKDTERQAGIRVDSGRILLHMCLFLHSFKLSKQKDRGILDGVRLAFH